MPLEPASCATVTVASGVGLPEVGDIAPASWSVVSTKEGRAGVAGSSGPHAAPARVAKVQPIHQDRERQGCRTSPQVGANRAHDPKNLACLVDFCPPPQPLSLPS